MNIRVSSLAVVAFLAATSVLAAAAPPLAGVWNIAASGNAGSSGELRFRVHTTDPGEPLDIAVPVTRGTDEQAVARNIRRALGSQLRADRFRVELGEGSNVLVSDPRGRPAFALELVDSNVRDLRIAVQSVTPSASPTVPPQSAPAETQDDDRKPAGNEPGNTAPPASAPPGNSIPLPSLPPAPSGAMPVPSPPPAPSGAMPVPSPPPAPSPTMPLPSTPEMPAPSGPPPTSPPASAPRPKNDAPPPDIRDSGTHGSGAQATTPPSA